jgi:hypothetical protein
VVNGLARAMELDRPRHGLLAKCVDADSFLAIAPRRIAGQGGYSPMTRAL